VGLPSCGHGFGLLPSIGSFALSRKSTFASVSPVPSFYFCNHIISTNTSGNRSIAQVYVCMNVYFPPFWNYVGGINMSLMTANSAHDTPSGEVTRRGRHIDRGDGSCLAPSSPINRGFPFHP
jgi:hypothetical protein